MGQQDAKLASHYYKAGEYEKSAALYKKLAEQKGFNEYYFNQYIESLLALEDYETAETSLQKSIKQYPRNIELHVAYGNLRERQGRTDEADEQFRLAISKLTPENRNAISRLGNSFSRLTKYDLALETFLKGEELSNNNGLYAYNIAELYRRKNKKPEMIKYFLASSAATPERISSVQNYFTKYLISEEDYEALRAELYAKVQNEPENLFYPEMIQWVFVHNKQYTKALRQARALDKRLDENGQRIYNLARIAKNDKDYDTAIKAYQYIIDTKENINSYYLDAKKQLLDTKRKKIISGTYTTEDLNSLKAEYIDYLDTYGRNSQSSLVSLKLAELEARYINDLDAGVKILNEVIKYPGINNYVKANAKLDLADYYLMSGEVWESTLLYSQVDKEFREDHLGEKARFKNAKLSYYIGDFEWAQEQFDILKSATTRLISNDAIDLSVFIMDNANLDTTYAPLALFSEAELLLFQNRVDEAFNKLDSIGLVYNDHTLIDDVYYAKAVQYTVMGDIDNAVDYYQRIIEEYPEEIRADNAIFNLAVLYDEVLDNDEKAKELYQTLFIDYPDSTFSIEARKRFRILRGDNI
jgi:tetratricopeptide (TPR) repeat protein